LGGASDNLTSSLLCNEPILNEGNGAAGVKASGDVYSVFVRASAARALVFCFFIYEGEHLICGAEVGDLFDNKVPKHFGKGSHNSVHTSPIYQVEVMGMDNVSLIEELSSHLFTPIMGELPLHRSSEFLPINEYSHLLKWE